MAKSPQKKVGRPANSLTAPGIYIQKGKLTFWLRYSVGGEQVRVSLGTTDPDEANKRAAELRGRPVVSKKTGKTTGGKTEIDRALERYQAEKTKSRDFVSTSSKGAAQAVKHFVSFSGLTDPAKITTKLLEDYYADTRTNKSESTAQTYATRVSAFARWAGMRVTTPSFESEAPARSTVIPSQRVAELLSEAKGEIRFVLFCGFRAGMRRGEITMARPSWFDLDGGVIHIPAKDPVSGFVPKSGRARTIPLVAEFRDFLRAEYPDWNARKFVLRPDKEVGKWIYRFDFRKLFSSFAKRCPGLTPHVMRHSYASHLANGGVGIAQLASWTGDRIATLERHYLHLLADAEKAEAAFFTEPRPAPEPPDCGPLPPIAEIRKRRFDGE